MIRLKSLPWSPEHEDNRLAELYESIASAFVKHGVDPRNPAFTYEIVLFAMHVIASEAFIAGVSTCDADDPMVVEKIRFPLTINGEELDAQQLNLRVVRKMMTIAQRWQETRVLGGSDGPAGKRPLEPRTPQRSPRSYASTNAAGKIQAFMLEKGWTWAQFVAHTNMSEDAVRKSVRSGKFGFRTAHGIASVMKTTVAELFDMKT